MTMEEDANVPRRYISEHEGFYGTIKSSTKDFIVTEIDIHGQMVTNLSMSDGHSSNVTEACPSVNKSDSRKIVNPKCSLKPEEYIPDRKDTEPCQNGDSFDLSLILGQDVNEELERFTVTLRETSLSPSDSCGEKLAYEELSLGSFPDKHKRANVHRAVRHNFPFLLTVTNQSEIRVREDPDFKHLSGLVSEEEAEDFFRFIDAKIPNSVYTFKSDDRKEHRTAVHHFLSKRFGKLVETKSFSDQENKTSITVRLREKPKKRTADECSKEIYTAFALKKENLETLEAISYLAAILGVLPSDFTYAGIKDKRAITYQSMVVKKITPQQLKEKAGEFGKRGMVLSSFRSVSEPLHLGRLQGNHFDLLVRDLRPHGQGQTDLDSLVREAVENVKVRGFVNYYGPQRFGTGQSVQSDRVGLALLREDMVTAVRLFLTPEEGDDPQNVAKRHFVQTDNAKEALALMPASKARERLMLRALHRYGTGPDGCTRAWLSLPHSMRVFYPHAYCSRVWNEAVTHRLTTLGHKVRQGDLVRGKNGGRAEAGEPSPPQIHVVTATEEEEGAFSLAEVVLPMPGNSIKYPENAVGTWYQERLTRDGLQSCRFRVSSLKLNLPGCYRPLQALPRNLSYRLERQGGGGSHQETNSKSPLGNLGADTPNMLLNFDLDPSCYATVCLREVMKCDP